MNRPATLLWFILSAIIPFVHGWAAAPASCPIQLVVGTIRDIDGDMDVVRLIRDGRSIQVTPRMCLLYGDRLEAGIQTTVTIDTAHGLRHVGGDWDSAWVAPKAAGPTSPDVAALLGDIFRRILDAPQHGTAYATSRAPDACPRKQAPGIVALQRLAEAKQDVGFDLLAIVAAWVPTGDLRKIRVLLLDNGGRTLTAVVGCADSHLVLRIPAGKLKQGDRLTVDLSDEVGGSLRYDLTVVRPDDLPPAPFRSPEEWQSAAWRLAAGPPNTHLDALSRLYSANTNSLGARWILDAVWNDNPF